jgi:hypothetical protein
MKLDELITQLDIAGMGHNATVLLDCVKELKARVDALEGTPPAAPEKPRASNEWGLKIIATLGSIMESMPTDIRVRRDNNIAWYKLDICGAPTAAPAETPAPDGEWRDLQDDEAWKRGDRWTSTGDKGWHKTVLTSDTCTIGAWKQDIFPMHGHAQRRVENAKRSKWVSVCDHLPPLGLTVCVKVADDPDPQADWLNDMSEWETEAHVTHWRFMPKFKAERDA